MAAPEEIDLSAPVTSDTLLEIRSGKMAPLAGAPSVLSGIDKHPLPPGPVYIGPLGIPGDEHDLTFHGGPDKAILAFSLPRQPCFKLNQRFGLKDFAPTTWQTRRTGWYYRVLTPGSARVGDEVRVVEKGKGGWSVGRVQEYLHRTTGDEGVNGELAGLEGLGGEARGVFAGRVKRARGRVVRWRGYRVVERRGEGGRVVGVVLEAVEKEDGDGGKVEAGAHVKVKLGNGLVRAYSVVDGERDRFQLGVGLAEGGGKGGRVQVGTITVGIKVSPQAAGHHVFVAAGVGITAFLALVERMKATNWSFVLHYGVRSAEDVPFRERLERLGESVVIYDKSKGQRLDIPGILEGMPWNSHVYFCGPSRLMQEAAREVKAKGIPEKEVHFEAFEADLSGDPFEAVVANRGGKLIKVGEEETLLEMLQANFEDVASSCSVGNCGTCKIGLKEGRVEHRGTALTEEEKSTSMLACVSRGIGRITIEI
ncbi:pyruvate kinase-like protein [Schizothecium vesticola]|uniref:Pyruvate kinase-like protein n=1 Tax=Schizothecium vesticola TaxID=314040 RepID=A0AA40EKY7_9PEZI|nr:pyruvate kinase-like protein [Schizothecium vesticola]